MEKKSLAPQGMAVTPHYLASQSALRILKKGGTAMEAMVAAAATISIVYPHMNSIGGDGFWLIIPPNGDSIVIEACGAAGSLANEGYFTGFERIPFSGPKSAITVAGTVGGWEEALKYVTESGYQRQPLSELLADAITYAEEGFPISQSHVEDLQKIKLDENDYYAEFKNIYLPNGAIPKEGQLFQQTKLAKTLKTLAKEGLNSFYKGNLAEMIAKDMELLGMPITVADLANYTAKRQTPLTFAHSYGEILNIPPPTQGILSLLILGILDKLRIDGKDEGQFIHATVEATKQAFVLRDEHITDPCYMKVDAESLMSCENISKMAKNIDFRQASTLGKGEGQGDTVWLGVMDNKGYSVSFIQSSYFPFGCRVVLPDTGIVWHNRGIIFTLIKDHIRYLVPGKKPFQTLNPAAAKLKDGRLMIYGTKGGDAQPQTQAAIFHRYVVQKKNLQTCISDPRWLYGGPITVLGEVTDLLYMESRYSNELIEYLRNIGHNICILPPFCSLTGQAGALVRHPNGMLEGACDPRSDGMVAGF